MKVILRTKRLFLREYPDAVNGVTRVSVICRSAEPAVTEADNEREGKTMADREIRRIDGMDEAIGDFIHDGFSRYGERSGVELNYDAFCFVAREGEGGIVGAITGRAYYDEVHIGDLIVDEAHRGRGWGRRLVAAVEAAYSGKGYGVLTLTTFGFQAPGFYRKLGFDVEFVRENANPKLSKYFMIKALQ